MFDKSTLDIVKQKCSEYNVDTDLLSKLLIDSNKYKHFSNNTKLNQQWLHQDIVEKIEDEGNKELNYED